MKIDLGYALWFAVLNYSACWIIAVSIALAASRPTTNGLKE